MKKCVVVILIIAMLITGIIPASGGVAKAASVKGVVNTEGLNVRTGAGTNFPVMQYAGVNVKLSKGTKVSILDELAGGWYKISFTYGSDKMTGYVAAMYTNLSVSKNMLAQNIGISGKMLSKQKIRTKASAKASYLTHDSKTIKLKKNRAVKITGVFKVSGAFWYRISFTYYSQEMVGYISASKVKLSGSKLISAYMLDKTSVRTSAGDKKPLLKVKKKTVNLKKGKKIKVIKEKTVKNKKWFYVRFINGGKTRKGWVKSGYVMFTSGTSAVITPASTASPAPTAKPTPTPPRVLNDAEFETDMTAQGYPESYKPYLRQLHASYPNWQFKLYNTGFDWNSAVVAESKIGNSLLPNTKQASWLSSAAGAFDYVNDAYVVYDGTSWVCASNAAVAYYMDPRNFLTDKYIFMFESLDYQPYQTVDHVASILSGTIYSGASYYYADDTGAVKSKTYQDTFVEAAAATGVSPFHLASRMKQEVVTGTSTVSNAVTGTVAGYEGIYNFYNINAFDSAAGTAIMNGLNYASSGTTFMRPWNNPFKAIVGGAQFIADNYVSKGQNTVYLEKFNVTPNNTYTHQYMTNIAAPYSESAKIYTAYKDWMATKAVVFHIPVYSNMPETACVAPSGNNSPNNYIKTLSVKDTFGIADYALSPVFNVADGGTPVYTITVPSTETTAVISAEPVNANAVISGIGAISLVNTVTYVQLTVTAQDGSTRVYTFIIIKN